MKAISNFNQISFIKVNFNQHIIIIIIIIAAQDMKLLAHTFDYIWHALWWNALNRVKPECVQSEL